MNRLALLPFALFLIVLPFPGTVALRLLLLAICFGIALWHWWRAPESRSAFPCKPALATWIAVCAASLAYAANFAYTVGELKNELGYAMMAFFAFFTLAGNRQAALWMFRAVALGLVLIGSWAAAAWFANGLSWNEGGPYGGTGNFATYLVTIVPLLVWLAFADPLRPMRRIAVGLLLFAVLLLAIAMQRAAWPVLVAQAVLSLVLAVRHHHVGIGWRRAVAALFAIGVVALAGMFYNHHARFETPGNEVRLSADVRVAFWPKVVAKITEHPWAGAGFGRNALHNVYPELIPADTPLLWHAHNVFLNYGLETGVPGMLALACLFGAFAFLFWQAAAGSAGWAGIAGLAVVAGVVLRNQFNDFFMRDMSLLYWALIALLARLSVDAKKGAA